MTDHPITMTDPEAALWTEMDVFISLLTGGIARPEVTRA